MRLIGEFFELPFWRLYVFCFQILEERKVRRLFYKDSLFRRQDLALLKTSNPYQEKKAYPYGETPLTVGKALADRFGLCAEDRVVDLGCGRGRLSSFFAFYKGCSVLGVDWVESFISTAQDRCGYPHLVSLMCLDFRLLDFSSATFVYFYGIALNEEDLRIITENLSRMSPGAKVITVSEPLNHPSFTLADQMDAVFPWGKGELFLNIVN